VRAGQLHGLGALTVLVGANGGGKTTVLEALAIGAGHRPASALGAVVQARGGCNGAAYLLRTGATEGAIEVHRERGALRRTTLRFQFGERTRTGSILVDSHGGIAELKLSVEDRPALPRRGEDEFRSSLDQRPVMSQGMVRFDAGNEVRDETDPAVGEAGAGARAVSAAGRWGQPPLWASLGRVVRLGRDAELVELLRSALGAELRDLTFIPEAEDARLGNVHLRYTWGSVPVDLAGDGVRALVRLALELAAPDAEMVLLDEPAAQLHTAGVKALARAIWAACGRGAQVVLATNSLELIDALLDEAPEGSLDALAVLQVALVDGQLRTHQIAGPDVRDLRFDIGQDLR
jgi:energy-coupling factor transporter ATP-binding protein EcfA2